MWKDHGDANVAELRLQHLFGLGTDVDRRHVHGHSKVVCSFTIPSIFENSSRRVSVDAQ